MNRYDFTQPSGFPFDQGVMAFIQDCINTAAATAVLAGPFAILSGCVVAGGSVSDGMVVINGEILPFVGGVAETNVRIQETGTVLAYQDGTPRTTKFTRVARFGNAGGPAILWADFKRNTAGGLLARLESAEARMTRAEGLLSPFLGAGGMVWWKGTIANIPAGWREVQAWRGKLPMAAKAPVGGIRPANFDIGFEAGAETHTLTAAEIPELDTESKFSTGAGSAVSGYVKSSTGGLGREGVNPGGGAAHSILNPYKVGCWIEPIPGTFII